jgi:hypothetical protein
MYSWPIFWIDLCQIIVFKWIYENQNMFRQFLGVKQQAKNVQSWPQVFSTLTPIVKPT